MASFTGTKVKDTYPAILKTTDNAALSGSLKVITDGLGNNSALSLSTAGASVTGTLSVSGGITGTLSTAAQTNITSVGTLSSLAVSGNLTVDTNTLFVDAANNRVGINESSPDVPLDVVGSGNSDVDVLTIGNFEQDDSGDETANLRFDLTRSYTNTLNNAGYIKVGKERAWSSSGGRQSFMSFYTRNGASDPNERMRIDSSGNITQTASGNPQFTISGSAGAYTGILQINGAGGGGSKIIASGGTNTLSFETSGSERMRIDAAGNFMVGATSALGKVTIVQGTSSNKDTLVLKSPNASAAGSQPGIQFRRDTDALLAEFFADTNTGDLITNVNGSERMRILSSGGITFNGDTSSANALDDYEEGTFTPTASGASSAGTTSYSNQYGYYTKIGRQVNVTLVVSWTAMTGTGTLRVGGLPFTVATLTNGYPIGTCLPSGLNWSSGTYLQSVGITGESFMHIVNLADDTDETNQQCVNESASIRVTMTYFV